MMSLCFKLLKSIIDLTVCGKKVLYVVTQFLKGH